MEQFSAEQRREERFPFLKTIDYSCDSGASGVLFRGVTINISHSGLCLYLFENPCMNRLGTLNIRSELPVQADRGRICWVDKVAEGFYKAGLKFV
ncbi:MAG: PilZ domain-containing protein [Nitrospirae bacterium]|nr:MAG: PilZ domain-containing protein [Nitrospirota bacterium]